MEGIIMTTCTKCERLLHNEKILFNEKWEYSRYSSLITLKPEKYEIVLCKDCIAIVLRQLIHSLNQPELGLFLGKNGKYIQEYVAKDSE